MFQINCIKINKWLAFTTFVKNTCDYRISQKFIHTMKKKDLTFLHVLFINSILL